METPKPFRALIVGGGLVGLTAAHIFSKANIDFLVLEKHDTPFSPYGTTLALWPQTFRIFDQLGLLEAVRLIQDVINEDFGLSTEDARIITRDKMTELVERNHGYGHRIVHRLDMLKLLYETLPDTVKTRILLKKQVLDATICKDLGENYLPRWKHI
ncbi:hypothetical protein F5X99DRAFT_426670 [Biscogniauxia marginata]|nr:hypothetical protein F5X99DRAFT_426670 [Biscogniauxia marginata]